MVCLRNVSVDLCIKEIPMMIMVMMMIIFYTGDCIYVPATNHVSSVSNVIATVYLQNMVV